ncbi:hypothetical protein EVAR_34213_1 [Eumeta japonica]|uniref:Uncharacterized protein n=1 Tax=Eumeta variegata TaxID=151549 RepID=A0A4C1WKR3_EUMVA|nr:hypothetical protein EVAR_34213_1 [Eumeta japonica]
MFLFALLEYSAEDCTKVCSIGAQSLALHSLQLNTKYIEGLHSRALACCLPQPADWELLTTNIIGTVITSGTEGLTRPSRRARSVWFDFIQKLIWQFSRRDRDRNGDLPVRRQSNLTTELPSPSRRNTYLTSRLFYL